MQARREGVSSAVFLANQECGAFPFPVAHQFRCKPTQPGVPVDLLFTRDVILSSSYVSLTTTITRHLTPLNRLPAKPTHRLRLSYFATHRRQTPNEQFQITQNHISDLDKGLRHSTGAMSGKNGVLQIPNWVVRRKRFFREHIGRHSQPSVANRLSQRIEIHHRRPAHQDKKPARPDKIQLPFSQKALVLCGHTSKNKDRIRPS